MSLIFVGKNVADVARKLKLKDYKRLGSVAAMYVIGLRLMSPTVFNIAY